MLLVDSDEPTEWMIHCWSLESALKFAILFDESGDGEVHTLLPRWFYRVGDSGNLFLPATLTADEQKFISNLRVVLRREGANLAGTWQVTNGDSGAIEFDFSPPNESYVVATPCSTWDDFKMWARDARSEQQAAIFRGHGCSKFRLRTTLHRTGRLRIDRYAAQELRQFSQQAEAVLNKDFDLENASDYASVLGLAQHHGLPTPLLDWTASPYIAAFFAFSDALEFQSLRENSTHVRIYAISKSFIDTASPPIVNLVQVQPFVSALQITPRHNVRLHVQQGRFLVTNVSNIENFFKYLEADLKTTFLYAADVPVSVATEALEDLSYMGLTAATLFPGMDGIGRTIRHSMLFKKPYVRSTVPAPVS